MNEKPKECASLDADENGVFAVGENDDLVNQGWQRRQLTSTDQATECKELYRSLGFEVLIYELSAKDFNEKCQACAVEVCQQYVVIYTREKEID